LRAALAPNSQFEPAQALGAAARLAAETLASPLLAAALAALLIGVVQTQGLVAPAALRGQLDPLAHLRALMAPERALQAASAWIAALVLTAVALYTIAPSLPGLLALPGATLGRALERLSALTSTLIFRLVLTALALGVLDLLVQRVRQQLRLRMTRRELQHEQREQYGDPQLRAERFRRARRDPRGGA
jgi:flagellar biosynthesis protein FlhB